MGAIAKGIAVAPVCGVEQLGAAGGARRCVRYDGGARGAGMAGKDSKIGRRGAGVRGLLDRVNAGQRRGVGGQPCGKFRQLRWVAPCGDGYALAVVGDMADKAQRARQMPDVRTKPHALHQPAHPDSPRLQPHRFPAHQCTVQTIQGSNDRTICCTATGSVSPARMGAPCKACSSGPGTPAASRGLKFHVVGAMI